jgi:hypothetical protein
VIQELLSLGTRVMRQVAVRYVAICVLPPRDGFVIASESAS